MDLTSINVDVTWAIAILGAIVTAIGWLISHALSESAERRRQNLLAQLQYTRQQLEELYGPLAFLIWEGRQTFRDLFEALEWKALPPADQPLSEEVKRVWLFWVDNDFFPRNQKIEDLMSAKSHLIEGETMPRSFLEFLDHYNSWLITHRRWEQQGVEYGWRSKIPWPNEFDDDVLGTFEMLKKRQSHLMGQITERR